MTKQRIHLVALPHTQVSPAFCGCAYTAKVLKFCKMMGDDYEIFLYAPEGPPVPGATLIPCLPDGVRQDTFGKDDPHRLPAWPTDEQSVLFNRMAADAIKDRAEPHDLVLLSGGRTHLPIAEAVPHLRCIEPGVGYEGIFTGFCAFESAAWMHHVYAKSGINDGRNFDAVIPNYFDMDDFPLKNMGGGKYLMFLGRLISRKGPHIAAEVAKAAGMELVVAGAGGKMIHEGLLRCDDGTELHGNIRYVGPVDVMQRAELLSHARALLVPTTYIEPFGGVAVEAQLCGTPVIASDWGAFRETVQTGITGYRFRTLAEGKAAVEKCADRFGDAIRSSAQFHYSLEAVRPQFKRWFAQLGTLWEGGWYQLPADESKKSFSTS